MSTRHSTAPCQENGVGPLGPASLLRAVWGWHGVRLSCGWGAQLTLYPAVLQPLSVPPWLREGESSEIVSCKGQHEGLWRLHP